MTTQDGQKFNSDFVISTVSIGVLNNDIIKFKPELPIWKKEALSQCGMGLFCKIFMKFETRFWGQNSEFNIANEKKGYYPMWISLDRGHQTNLIMCVVVGDEGRRVEKLSDELIKDEI